MTTPTRRRSKGDLERLTQGATEEVLAELARAAYVDPLTGLLNRRALDRDLAQRLAVAKRGLRPMTVVVGDLDGLKAINDRDGHAAGDLALRALGAALDSALRAGDTAYRIGGDEFLLLLADTDAGQAGAVMSRVRSTAPAFSSGSATFPCDGENGSRLVELADQRLLAARREMRTPSAVVTGTARPGRPRGAGAFAAAALAIAALVGGVGVGFAAENVMDSREEAATPAGASEDSNPTQPTRPGGESVDSAAPVVEVGATAPLSSDTSIAPDASGVGIVIPPSALDPVDELLPVPALHSIEAVEVVEVVEETLDAVEDVVEDDREPAADPDSSSGERTGEAKPAGGPKQSK